MDGKELANMSQDNQITLRGYLTAEPKLHQKTAGSVPVTEIRVGCTPRRLNRETGEWQDGPTSYFRIKCWRRLAINTASSLHKGDMVVVRGKFFMNHWIDNQQRSRATLEIEADSIGHDLTYGWSHFLRGSRSQSGRPADVNAGEMARQDYESADAGDADDEYSADGDPGESTTAAFAHGDQVDSAYPGFRDDPSGDPSEFPPTVIPAVSPVSITESDGNGGDLRPGGAPAESGLADDSSLPEAEAVPF
jgi:single-strand DNA-binding protein